MIDNKTYSRQKAALTRAVNTKDVAKIRAACKKAVSEWGNDWPDDWARWQRALDDASPVFSNVPRLEDL